MIMTYLLEIPGLCGGHGCMPISPFRSEHSSAVRVQAHPVKAGCMCSMASRRRLAYQLVFFHMNETIGHRFGDWLSREVAFLL